MLASYNHLYVCRCAIEIIVKQGVKSYEDTYFSVYSQPRILMKHCVADANSHFFFKDIFIQGSTFRINHSVFQSGPVSPKLDILHVNVKITYTVQSMIKYIKCQ